PAKSITQHTGRKLDFAIIGVLTVAVALLLTDRFVLRHGVNQATAVPTAEKSIAVLPFENLSEEKQNECREIADLKMLSAGQFSVLHVLGTFFRGRSHHAVIRVYDEAGNVIETHEHAREFKEP